MLTAVDWSGDAGAESEGPNKPGVIAFAFVSIDEVELDVLRLELAAVRRRHGFDPTHVFKHMKSSGPVKRDFFTALLEVQMEIRVLLIDKMTDWPEHLWKARGNDRIAVSLADGAGRLPVGVVGRQTLLLDLDHRKDGRFATQIIKAVHQTTRRPGSPGFRKIRCCPDSDSNLGDIVQVADMTAGVVRRYRTVHPTEYPEFSKIVVPL